MPASTIEEVLSQLQEIIDSSEKSDDRIGYFASLYYKVTSQVRDGITQNKFEDGPRMATLDVIFANRYLAAMEQWKKNQPLTNAWKIALEATRSRRTLVLQHLLLGINAHINLDLGIAAVETMQSGQIEDIHNDFNSINTIIGSLTYEVIHDINQVSPLISLIGLHSGNNESLLVQFSISNARDGAWCFAEDLSKRTGTDYSNGISARDADIAKLADTLVRSRGVIRFTLWIIHLFEWKNVRKVIALLNGGKKVFMRAVDLPE